MWPSNQSYPSWMWLFKQSSHYQHQQQHSQECGWVRVEYGSDKVKWGNPLQICFVLVWAITNAWLLQSANLRNLRWLAILPIFHEFDVIKWMHHADILMGHCREMVGKWGQLLFCTLFCHCITTLASCQASPWELSQAWESCHEPKRAVTSLRELSQAWGSCSKPKSAVLFHG